jgi:uncharacterized glyoxalase superfamily protein PhnB
MAPVGSRPAVIPALSYKDPRAALDWLGKAFGFEIEMLIEDDQGNPLHSEMRYGEGLIMIGSEWNADTKSPSSIGRKCTQTVHIHLTEDINAHCARAEKAGAEILEQPSTQFYGDRTYRARDPEGHIWTFGMTEQVMTPAEWDKIGGTRTTMR